MWGWMQSGGGENDGGDGVWGVVQGQTWSLGAEGGRMMAGTEHHHNGGDGVRGAEWSDLAS